MGLRVKIYFLFVFFLLLFTNGQSQDSLPKPIVFGFNGHYGFIIPHSGAIKNISGTNPFGIEFSIAGMNHREKDWQQCNCYSSAGISLSYIDFANPDKLGKVATVSVYVEPVLRYNKKLFFTIRLGTGVSYITKVYDKESNPENLFFSSPVSFPLYVHFYSKLNLNKNFNIHAGACYNHISNGGVKQPNKGMNFPTLMLGIEYTLRPVILIPRKKQTDSLSYKLKYDFRAFTSVKVYEKTDKYDEKPCLIFGLSTRVIKPVSSFNSLSLGAEYVWDGYIKERINRDSLNKDNQRLSLTLGNDVNVGRFVFTIQLGAYAYAPYPGMDPVYQKYDLTYKITKHIFCGVYLKAHRHVAELMGVSLGFIP